MKICSVNEIRTTLYPMVLDIFTEEFKSKYESNIKQYELTLADIMLEESDHVDSFVKQLSLCIGSPSSTNLLVKKCSPKCAVVLFMRYHFITQYLISEDQDKKMMMPSKKSDFLIYLFTEFYLDVVSK